MSTQTCRHEKEKAGKKKSKRKRPKKIQGIQCWIDINKERGHTA